MYETEWGEFLFRDHVLALLAAQPAETPEMCGVVWYPEAGRKVCELPKGHEGDYHQDGRVRWTRYHEPTAAQPAHEDDRPRRGESREEFERDRFGETGERLASERRAKDDWVRLQRWRDRLKFWRKVMYPDDPIVIEQIVSEMDAALASTPKEGDQRADR